MFCILTDFDDHKFYSVSGEGVVPIHCVWLKGGIVVKTVIDTWTERNSEFKGTCWVKLNEQLNIHGGSLGHLNKSISYDTAMFDSKHSYECLINDPREEKALSGR